MKLFKSKQSKPKLIIKYIDLEKSVSYRMEDPEKAFDLILEHLKEHGFKGWREIAPYNLVLNMSQISCIYVGWKDEDE